MTEMVYMYNCGVCGFNSSRKDSFLRHQNSKKHIVQCMQLSYHTPENVTLNQENVNQNSQNVNQNQQNVIQNQQNVNQNEENVTHNDNNVSKTPEKGIYKCIKCNKSYKHREYLENHERNCTGVDSLTCPTCMKTFSCRQAKHNHCKKNNCKPVSIFEAENIKSIIHNNANATQSYNSHSLNTTNNTTNNNNNNVTNITKIYINDYGKERKDYLWTYDNFYDIIRVPNNNILVKYLKCKNFNPLFPENHCIKYENKCFKLKENNRWNLINPTALKDKLFYDCGSEVLQVFDNNEDKIKEQIDSTEHFEAVKRKTSFLHLQMEGNDKSIKNSMLDIVKDVKDT